MIDAEAAHGLEQQLIHALVECLSKSSAIEAAPATCEHRDVALRLEALLQTDPEQPFRTTEICKTLGITPRSLAHILRGTARHGSDRVHSPPPDAVGRPRVKVGVSFAKVSCKLLRLIQPNGDRGRCSSTCVGIPLGEIQMPSSAVRTFTDPDDYAAAIRETNARDKRNRARAFYREDHPYRSASPVDAALLRQSAAGWSLGHYGRAGHFLIPH